MLYSIYQKYFLIFISFKEHYRRYMLYISM